MQRWWALIRSTGTPLDNRRSVLCLLEVRVVVGGRESGFQFEKDVFVVFFAGGLTESLVPLVGTSLHVNSRVQNLSLREPADEKRTEIPEETRETSIALSVLKS